MIEKALQAINASYDAGTADSHISDIDSRALLVVTLLYLVLMLSVPVQALDILIWFAVYPIITAPLAHERYERVLLQSLIILPFLLIFAIFNPIYDHRPAFTVMGITITQGWISFFSIILRGLLSLQALLLLIKVCGFRNMCMAMYKLGLPAVMATQLQMLYRYIGVLLAEALTMRRAREARGYGRNSFGMKMWGEFVGQLMLRTIERGRRLDMAMRARGFNGKFPESLAADKWSTPDTVYCMAWIGVFLLLRFAHISSIFQ